MSILQLSRKKVILAMTVCIFLYQIFFPITALAIGGPSQPEFSNFEPTSNTEMVNTLNGDFQYSLNVLDIEGYKLNLDYSSSGLNMEKEASWVGLGWNLNPGAVTRQMRGLPDDFKGDKIEEETYMKDNNTYGINIALDAELVGLSLKQGLNLRGDVLNLGLSYNNYNGFGLSYNPSISLRKGPRTGKNQKLSLGINLSSESGAGLSFSYSRQDRIGYGYNQAGLGLSLSSRRSMAQVSMNLNTPSASNMQNIYSTPQQTPSAPYNTSNVSVNIHGHITTEVFGLAPGFGVGANISTTKLTENVRDIEGYGYYYYEEADPDDDYIDHVRDMEGEIEKNTRVIPHSFCSPDIYSFGAQGLSGSFSLERNDIMIVGQREAKSSQATSVEAGFDIGPGGIGKLGASLNIGYNKTEQRTWNNRGNKNKMYEVIQNYNEKVRKDDQYKFFKETSSAKFSDNEKFEILRKFNSLTVPLAELPKSGGLNSGLWKAEQIISVKESNLISYDNFSPSAKERKESINYQKISRDKSGNIIITYTNDELVAMGDQFGKINHIAVGENQAENIYYHPRKVITQTINRSNYKGHHIGKITVISKNGTRYNYDIPVYNKYTLSERMRVNDNSFSSDGLCSISGSEGSKNNSSGKDHYYNKKKIPGHAHSYLLTSIISPDYVDVTGDGMSADDFGNAHFFYYERTHDDFVWRLPFEGDKAIFNPGLHCLDYDNTGIVESGSKEIWNLRVIMSKNRIARFISNETTRKDGISQYQSKKVKSLDRIELYDRHDLTSSCKNNISSSCDNAVPLKTVHLEYDNSLCSNLPNSTDNTGKLTLKKVYFTFGESEKGRLSPYEFDYSDVNPNYNYAGKDPWGSYKVPLYKGKNMHDWPYSVKEKSTADETNSIVSWGKIAKLPMQPPR